MFNIKPEYLVSNTEKLLYNIYELLREDNLRSISKKTEAKPRVKAESLFPQKKAESKAKTKTKNTTSKKGGALIGDTNKGTV